MIDKAQQPLHQRIRSDIIYSHPKAAPSKDEGLSRKRSATKYDGSFHSTQHSNKIISSAVKDSTLKQLNPQTILKQITNASIYSIANKRITSINEKGISSSFIKSYAQNAKQIKLNSYLKNAALGGISESKVRNAPFNNIKGVSMNEYKNNKKPNKESPDSKEDISNYSSERSQTKKEQRKETPLNKERNTSNETKQKFKLNCSLGKHDKYLLFRQKINKSLLGNNHITEPSTIAASPMRKLSQLKNNLVGFNSNAVKQADPVKVKVITKEPTTSLQTQINSQYNSNPEPQIQQINQIEKYYEFGKILGSGAFGKVYLGYHKLSNCKVAIKTIKKEFLENKDNLQKLMREVDILNSLHHTSIVQLYEQFDNTNYLFLVLELCAGGDLLSYVRKRKKLNEEQARFIFRQLIEGVSCCHGNMILHRDIKLDNILFNSHGQVKVKG